MKGVRITVSILLSLVFILSSFAGALADTSTESYPACSDGLVSGVVVGVATDEATGVTTVTIRYTAEDDTIAYCTVTLNGTYDQPIVQLLADYFGDAFAGIDLGVLQGALEDLDTCVVLVPGADPGPEDDTYAWNDCTDAEAIHVTVQSSNGDGTYVVLLPGPDGTTVMVAITGDAATAIDAALAALAVEWDVLGGNAGVGTQIANFHDMGIGFGVLVKLYSYAQITGLDIETLVADFQSGVLNMGMLMKAYKHDLFKGVGHVRKAYESMTAPADDPAAPADEDTPGNGKGKGKGKDNPNKPAPKPKPCNAKGKGPGC